MNVAEALHSTREKEGGGGSWGYTLKVLLAPCSCSELYFLFESTVWASMLSLGIAGWWAWRSGRSVDRGWCWSNTKMWTTFRMGVGQVHYEVNKWWGRAADPHSLLSCALVRLCWCDQWPWGQPVPVFSLTIAIATWTGSLRLLTFAVGRGFSLCFTPSVYVLFPH